MKPQTPVLPTGFLRAFFCNTFILMGHRMTNDLMTIDFVFGGQAVSLLLRKSRKPSSRNSAA
jgi:hypothetical protein